MTMSVSGPPVRSEQRRSRRAAWRHTHMTLRLLENPVGILETLVARWSLPDGLSRDQQSEWYGKPEGLLPTITIKYQRLQPDFAWSDTQEVARSPSRC